MKALVSAVLLAFASMTFAADLPTKPATKEELNCVKKDKAGKCPPAPKSPKPTPKKKAEAK
jgi:hypothetical protein